MPHAGVYGGAPAGAYRHPPQTIWKKLGCEVCHIPAVYRTAARGLCVVHGQSGQLPHGRRPSTSANGVRWQPDYRRDADEGT